MNCLVIIEHDNKELRPASLTTITAALQLQDTVDVLVIGNQCASVNEKLCKVSGISQIINVDSEYYAHPLAERFAPCIAQVGDNYSHLLAPATTFGKNIMPRVAALLGVAQISDITSILSKNTYERPVYAGNAIATVESCDPKQVITVRPTAFPAVELTGGGAKIVSIDQIGNTLQSEFINLEVHGSDRPELGSADIIISGGRGLQNKETFDQLMQIADRLGAAVGASRAAVDAGLAPNDFQVGQTGQVVAPKLYFAVGISGAIQHLAGMKDSKIIVAINKDPDAPIFQIADYGLVADINEVLPQWEQALSDNGL